MPLEEIGSSPLVSTPRLKYVRTAVIAAAAPAATTGVVIETASPAVEKHVVHMLRRVGPMV